MMTVKVRGGHFSSGTITDEKDPFKYAAQVVKANPMFLEYADDAVVEVDRQVFKKKRTKTHYSHDERVGEWTLGELRRATLAQK